MHHRLILHFGRAVPPNDFKGVLANVGDVTKDVRSYLVIVLPAANGVTRGTEGPQNQSNQQDDHSNGPQNLDSQHKSDDEKNQSKNNHHCPLS
jgi:hypothetical protein